MFWEYPISVSKVGWKVKTFAFGGHATNTSVIRRVSGSKMAPSTKVSKVFSRNGIRSGFSGGFSCPTNRIGRTDYCDVMDYRGTN